MRGRWAVALTVSLACASWCACSAPTQGSGGGRVARRAAASAAPVASSSPPAASAVAEEERDDTLETILQRVSATRQLPILRPVVGKSLSREALLAKLKAKMDEEIPPGVIALQGESLRALGVVPVDYDFEAGLLRLLTGRIAGLYDPDDRTMYLLDDLGDALKEETLNHELVHALQDQSFDLAPLLKFKMGQGDRTTAVQTLIEGDATSAMFEVAGASSLDIGEDSLRRLFLLSTRFSSDGLATPTILTASLISPYTDGFAFVNALRRRGGWSEVDAAFRHLPETTEQVLHLEKFIAREPPISIADPTLASLPPGFTADFVDSIGELGLRQLFEEWTARATAQDGAAGWGGDRYVVAHRKTPGGEAFATALHIRMDTPADAAEAASILAIGLGKPQRSARGPKAFCAERADLGPLAWKQRGADLAIVAGPYERRDGKLHAIAGCDVALKWLDETMGKP